MEALSTHRKRFGAILTCRAPQRDDVGRAVTGRKPSRAPPPETVARLGLGAVPVLCGVGGIDGMDAPGMAGMQGQVEQLWAAQTAQELRLRQMQHETELERIRHQNTVQIAAIQQQGGCRMGGVGGMGGGITSVGSGFGAAATGWVGRAPVAQLAQRLAAVEARCNVREANLAGLLQQARTAAAVEAQLRRPVAVSDGWC
jgi:hypothetical protein